VVDEQQPKKAKDSNRPGAMATGAYDLRKEVFVGKRKRPFN
jgi:hypothetical protein